MNTRQKLNTALAPLQDRLEAWQKSVDATEGHIKQGKALQNQGIQKLRDVHDGTVPPIGPDPVLQATTVMDRGIKIERESRDKLIELLERKPK